MKKKAEAAKPTVTFGAQGGFKFGNLGTPAAPAASGFTFGSKSPSPSQGQTGDHLTFEGQGLKLNTEQDAKDVVAKIVAFKNMKRLTFSANTVGIDAAKAIGVSLEKHPEFERAHWKVIIFIINLNLKF